MLDQIEELEKLSIEAVLNLMKQMSKKEQIAVAAAIYCRSIEMSIRAVERAKEVKDLDKIKDDGMIIAFIIKSDAYMNMLEKFIHASKVSYKKMYPIMMGGAKGIFDDYMTPDLENYWKSNEQNLYTIFDEILGHEWTPFIKMRFGKP